MNGLRAEFFFDDEAGNRYLRIPEPHIIGGGTASRAEAQSECLSAVSFAFQGDPSEFDTDAV